MPKQYWRVGELARAAGVTVRALHHYETVGLIEPPQRTESGYRLYGAKDVRRLYQVIALRSLGLSLAAIRDCLDSEDGTLESVVRRHLREVEQQIEEQARLRTRLQRILTVLERDEEPSADRFLEAMEAMTMFERYFTPEQLEELQERHRRLGDEAIKHGEQQWAELIQEAEAARQAGVDPASPELQGLWQRWQALIEQFTGGDPGIYRSLQNMYETEGIQQASRGSVSPELMAYMQRARGAAE
jgi:DNA-binding transcriptional MerR regulator